MPLPPFARSLRSLICSPLLALLIVLAQFGALSHEIGHVSEDLASLSERAHHGKNGKVCELCLAYGQIAAAVAAGVFALPPPDAHYAPVPARGFAFLPAEAPPAQSRGPPALL